MKQAIVFYAVALVFLFMAASQAAEFSPVLEEQLTSRAAGDLVSAIVILESPIDIRALDARLHDERANLARRHREIWDALHYNAETTQPQFAAELNAATAQGSRDPSPPRRLRGSR